MSVKKQIPSLCKLYSLYEEKPQEFLDETDVIIFFYRNISDIPQSHHQITRDIRGSNKKSSAIGLFQFCDIKTQQRFILQKEVKISKRELTPLVDSLREFFKTFDHASKVIQIPLPISKLGIGATKSKDNLFAHYFKDINDYPNRQLCLLFRFGNNNSCVFSIKKFELHGNEFILTEIVNNNQDEIHHL